MHALLRLVPLTTSVLRDGVETSVSFAVLVAGDRVVLQPGERAATDEVGSAGHTSLDLSAITDESVPVEAGPGDPMHAGAINGAERSSGKQHVHSAGRTRVRPVTRLSEAVGDRHTGHLRQL
ncbi:MULTISPECIES: hypothetical protein [Actinosynnema]|uniref:P-type ATPase n=1 Tax=Actinosynnema TaxID=40566 RepID=UPI0020A28816|nr:hypothetical protein [Actinosynnema pretiosum]